MDVQASMLLVFSGFYAGFSVFWATSKHKQAKSKRLKEQDEEELSPLKGDDLKF